MLSLRTALVLLVALLAGVVVGMLASAARHSLPEATIAALGAFAIAVPLLDRIIGDDSPDDDTHG
jgi:ABC-type antimicrobial peptide transport system permease subunit